jgi:hypothetical protein
MINIRKITSQVSLEFTYKLFEYTPIINGTMTISQGRGYKKKVIEFVWNMGASTYPTIKGQPYNKEQTEQLAGMLKFYVDQIEPDKL